MAGIPESVHVKIKRADHHISDLKVAIDAFHNPCPHQVTCQIDSDNRPTYRLAKLAKIDPIIGAITGDVIQNLRAALDYLACALWSRTNAGECKAIYFPITETASKYVSEGLRKIKGMGQDAVEAISAVEPYEGGKGDTLWRLHKLSMVDKHRLPITVAGGNGGVFLNSLYPEMFPKSEKPTLGVLYVGHLKCVLKETDILFIDDPGREVQQNLESPFFISLNEVGVVEGKPLIPTIKNMMDAVNHIVNSFAPLFP
jgi:hypothetical protein